MAVYFTMIFALSLCFIFNAYYLQKFPQNNVRAGKPTKFVSFLIVAILVLVAGLRYKVGADYVYYYTSYEGFKRAELNIFEEPGFKFLARLSEKIYDDPATWLFIAAFITVGFMAVTVIRNSEMYWLSILLYIFLGEWSGCFNGIRQYLAIAVLFAGHCFIKEKKLWHWLLVVFIAMLFHITAIIGIIFYFYPRIKLSVKNIFLSVLLVFVGIQAYDKIFALISFIKQDELILEGEGATYILNSINPLRIAVAWIPVIFFLIFMKYYNINQKKIRFYMNMSILNACFMTVAMNSAYLGRIGGYTNIYNTIVWPLLLQKIEKRSRKLLICLILLCYMIYWLAEMSKEDLAVFMWIFQR